MSRCSCGAPKPQTVYGVGTIKYFGNIRCEVLFSGLTITSPLFSSPTIPLMTLQEIVQWYERVSKPMEKR